MRRLLLALLFLPGILSAATPHSSRTYFVFIDDLGQTQIEDNIPPEYKQRGYRIVNESGVTLEVVPAARASSDRKRDTAATPSRSLSMRDKALLQTFSSVQDIETARDKHLLAMDGIIEVTRYNLELVSRNLKAIKESRRQIEASGEPVPEKMLADITEIRERIKENKSYIERKSAEKERINARYTRDIERFQELLGSAPAVSEPN